MSAFTESALIKKLLELNQSQQSIQTVSLWVIHHRRHHKTIVELWFKQMQKVEKSKKLVFMYLANDVIQNSKKKGPEYGKEFANILKNVFAHVASACKDGEGIINRFDRILSIWEERVVYEPKQIKEWYAKLHPSGAESTAAEKVPQNKPESAAVVEKPVATEKKRKHEETPSTATEKKTKKNDSAKTETVEVNGQIETHVTLSPKVPGECDPPEPEELITVLQQLENSASSDAVVREKITNLPPEVVEISMLNKLVDKEQAMKLVAQVDDAIKLLNDYNNRLAEEMAVRKKLTQMLRDFMVEQKDLLAHAEKRAEEHKVQLKKAKEVQATVKEQLKKLPDFSQLPDVTLPSAGDLFKLK